MKDAVSKGQIQSAIYGLERSLETGVEIIKISSMNEAIEVLKALKNEKPFPLALDNYQDLASQTALYPRPDDGSFPPYPALGLTGEAGEVAEKVKKAIRDDGGEITEERRAALIKELGDVLWYVAAMCSELDVGMGEVATSNLEKLFGRKQRGTIKGSGDDR